MGRACNPLFRPGPFLWKRDVFLKEPSRVTARTQRIRIGRPPRLHKHGEVPCLPRKPSSSIVPSLRLICFLLERDTHTRHGDMLVYTDLLTGEPPLPNFPFLSLCVSQAWEASCGTLHLFTRRFQGAAHNTSK
jgi:hypothetical protein